LFASEPPPRIWGVGRLVIDGALLPWPVTEADIDDEAQVASAHLRSLGVGAGDVVLVVALPSQAIHAVPVERAAGLVGALYSSADASESDAFRTAYLVGQLRPRAVIGVDAAVIDGLRAGGHGLGEVFGAVPSVVTTDETAHRALVDAGLRPLRWLSVGATSAVECADRCGLHLDGERWEVDVEAGQVLITNRSERLTPSERLPTGIRGAITHDACTCGRSGPRLLPFRA
jgi:hypothetical protein